MAEDPRYLEHLGELATLKNAIACWYHQDAFADFKSHEEIWQDIRQSHDSDSLELLLVQAKALLMRADWQIADVWNSQSSFGFTKGADARRFLGCFIEFLSGPVDH